MKRIAIAVLAILFWMIPLTSCQMKKDISVPEYAIYKDSEGTLYSVYISSSQYTHSICGIHSFTKTPPKSFQGYVYSFDRVYDDPTEETDENEKTYEDPFEHQSADIVLCQAERNMVEIYTKKQVIDKITALDLNEQEVDKILTRFLGFDGIEQTITKEVLGKEYNYDIHIELETFTYVKTVYRTYTFEKEYIVTETPVLDESGKKVGKYVTVASDGNSITYVEYK